MSENNKTQNELDELRQENKKLSKANAALRGLNKKLTNDLQRYVNLCNEGDSLYEKAISEKEGLEKEIQDLKENLHVAEFVIKQKNKEIEELENAIVASNETENTSQSDTWFSKLFSFFKC